ncbi:MAG: MOSC domain-containing protein [bacterium]|nr:MOSC domain-containing protein [bacterium]
MNAGRVVAICIGPGGIPKHPVPSIAVDEDGLAGDQHSYHRHGGRDRAVCIFSTEDYQALRRDGVEAEEPGTFGENFLTEGIDYAQLRAGDRLGIGDEVVVEIFDVRAPCAKLKSVDERFPNLMLGRSGFVCRVERGGTVESDAVVVRL